MSNSTQEIRTEKALAKLEKTADGIEAMVASETLPKGTPAPPQLTITVAQLAEIDKVLDQISQLLYTNIVKLGALRQFVSSMVQTKA